MTRPPVHKKISLSEGGNPFESKIGIRDGTSLRLDSLHDAEASFFFEGGNPDDETRNEKTCRKMLCSC
jgi:hypothetical protein